MRTVQVAKIAGSVGHGRDFRPDWEPFVEDERDKLLMESFRDRGFGPEESNRSPISLVECSREYFVEGDGHRRVSAAHRLKLRTIEAEVFELERKMGTGHDGRPASHLSLFRVALDYYAHSERKF